MKHATIARLFIILGAGALITDVAPTRCGQSAIAATPVAAAQVDAPGTGLQQ